jgi:hypothetical protein
MEWLPIETAPKDEQEILAMFGRHGFVMMLVSYSTIHGYWQSKGTPILGMDDTATHWMPLPPPPVEHAKV